MKAGEEFGEVLLRRTKYRQHFSFDFAFVAEYLGSAAGSAIAWRLSLEDREIDVH